MTQLRGATILTTGAGFSDLLRHELRPHEGRS